MSKTSGVVCFNPTAFVEEFFGTGCSNIFGKRYEVLSLNYIHTPVSIYKSTLQAMFLNDRRFSYCMNPTSYIMAEASLYEYVDALTSLIFEPIEIMLSTMELESSDGQFENDFTRAMKDPFYVGDDIPGSVSFADSFLEDAEDSCRALIIDAIRNSCAKLTGNFIDITYTAIEVD